jgi:hypothetical protein
MRDGPWSKPTMTEDENFRRGSEKAFQNYNWKYFH